MTDIKRPPRDITPQVFFEQWIPQEYERLTTGGAAPPDLSAQIQLDGDGGGTWSLRLAGGKLEVAAGSAEQPDVSVVQSVADWRAITVGEEGDGPDLTPPEGVSIEHWFVNPTIHQALKDAKGTLRFEIPGFYGRTFAAQLTFHGAAEPTATISVDAETVAEIRAGTLPAPQAFFAGKIQITGDSAFAMQIGMAVMAQ
ncbi:SCP2 sterol-binding domain-containing protein [Haliangium sp.]|uniref:SCP2 sterol-binding domain-containing protein n=1 Tax=Haliangium sp. TaxID=2663208 RepID=UPI003D0A15A4